jgi:hypothetical protein
MKKMKVTEGGLPPLKKHFDSTLNQLSLERGQATLPDLQFSRVELFP